MIHILNCHGEWGLVALLLAQLPVIGIGLRSWLGKSQEDE